MGESDKGNKIQFLFDSPFGAAALRRMAKGKWLSDRLVYFYSGTVLYYYLAEPAFLLLFRKAGE